MPAPGLLRALAAPLLLIVAVLGSILAGLASPTEAAGVGAVGALMLAGWRLDEARSRPILAGAGALAGLFVLPTISDTRLGGEIGAAPLVAIGLAALLAIGIFAALRRTWAARDENGARVIASVCRSTLLITAMVFSIVIGARLFSLVFIGLGGGEAVASALESLPGGTLGAVAIIMLAIFALGTFLEFLEIVTIVVPVVAPALLKMTMPDGTLMDPVWLGVMIAVNLQTSFLTPPVGATLFYLRGVAPPEVSTLDIYRGVGPFVALQLVALAVLWIFPGFATWLPGVLYAG